MKLVIVESPAKAKTIEKFLGSDYRVTASYGHIRDLPSSAAEVPAALRGHKWAKLGVNTEGSFEPVYVVPADSRARVSELRKLARKADELLLATDEDREGESISWHLLEELAPKVPVHRITFHEITRSAIQEALRHPRQVDELRVRAQETRRILDRLYGYSLSPVLWKKVRPGLSAGRVQSVALRLVVEREEERQRFRTASYWDVTARFTGPEGELAATLVALGDQRLASGRDFDATTGELRGDGGVVVLDEAGARRAAAGAERALPWKVARVDTKQTRQKPAPPFTTSTLQQAASSQLRMSPKQAMRVAQRLYEGIDLGGGEREGLITYMRTDSVTLSDKAIGDAAAWIRGNRDLGERYHQTRRYKTKAKGAQEAHEAIRPSEIARTPETMARYLERDELALYRLIWNRTVASQMADAELDQTTVELAAQVDGTPHLYRANGSILRFAGFLAVAGSQREDTLLPPLEEGQLVGGGGEAALAGPALNLAAIEPEGHETRPPARYTEATLVKKLEEEGIGRPSTYTPTISTIQDRDYVVKKGNYLVPTFVGMAVIHLLREHFPQYVDVKFTARMEEALDDIATGKVDWVEFLGRFYRGEGAGALGLEQEIAEELPRIEYPAIPAGTDPETGQAISVRIGQRSVYAQRGEGEGSERVTIPVDLLIDELTPERVLELIATRAKTDEPLGEEPETGKPVYLKIGPYGPYVQLGENDDEPKRTSLPRGRRPEDVDLDEALRLLALPRVIGKDPATGEEVIATLGRFGPYVGSGRNNRSLKSADQIFTVTLDEALKLLAQPRGRAVLKELGPHPESGRELQVLAGRYGPYLTDGELNASLPRDADPEAMTLDEAVTLLATKGKKPGSGRKARGRKAAPKKAAGKKPKAKKGGAKKGPAKRKTTPKKT